MQIVESTTCLKYYFEKLFAFAQFPFLKTLAIATPACIPTDVDVDLLYVF